MRVTKQEQSQWPLRVQNIETTFALSMEKMGSIRVLYIALLLSAFAVRANGSMIESMFITWGTQHTVIQGDSLDLVLDQISGSAAQSKKAFLFGSFEMLIKFVPGNSAGTVITFYLSTTGDKHDEIDFEFLGNSTGEPYLVHTNVYTKGVGGREQRFYLWFDPSADYHNYTIHWNTRAIVWYVDGVPLRVFRNYQSKGFPYPNQQGMRVYTSLWNADDWATRGGQVKSDWSNAPFIARLRNFRPRACHWKGTMSKSQCTRPSPGHWWNSPAYGQLSYAKQGQMNWARKNYMVYDYCQDKNRFNGSMPYECYLGQF